LSNKPKKHETLKATFKKNGVDLGYCEIKGSYIRLNKRYLSEMMNNKQNMMLKINGILVSIDSCRELIGNILRNIIHSEKTYAILSKNYVTKTARFERLGFLPKGFCELVHSCGNQKQKITSVELESLFTDQPLKLIPAILKLNEIESKFTKEKTKITYLHIVDKSKNKLKSKKNPFSVSLSNYWYKSSVHFSFALTILKDDYWNKKHLLMEALDFIIEHDNVFKGKNVCWPLVNTFIDNAGLFDYSDFTILGCLSFAYFLGSGEWPENEHEDEDVNKKNVKILKKTFYGKALKILNEQDKEELVG